MAQTIQSSTAIPTQEKTSTKDSVMASTVIAAHGIEHMYGRAFYVIIPDVREALALSYFLSYLMDGTRSMSSGLSSMLSGFFTDILQHRRVQILAISMFFVGIGYLLFALSSNYALMLVFLGPRAFPSVPQRNEDQYTQQKHQRSPTGQHPSPVFIAKKGPPSHQNRPHYQGGKDVPKVASGAMQGYQQTSTARKALGQQGQGWGMPEGRAYGGD